MAVLEAALERMAVALDRAELVGAGVPPYGAGPGSASHAGPVADRPGAGAAGGLGAALLALGARMRPGVQVVAEAVGLAEAVAGADLVLTGEGRVDGQTLDGKVPAGVCAVAAAAGVPVVVLGGSVDPAADLSGLGARAVREIAAGLPLAEALRRGPELLERATAAVLRELVRDPRPGGGAPERG
ncbi:glycerate kinase [Cellulomonas denverensis]|uniref:glycerate kinase n=1 Tax=Cellulomonas denverensis TaxID=264297 RepID=UPI0035EC1FA8